VADESSDLSDDLRAIRERLVGGETSELDAEQDGWDESSPGVSVRVAKPWRIERPKMPKIVLPDFEKQQEGIAKELEETTEAMRAANREKVAREKQTLEATEAVAAELRRANENDEDAARRDRWMVGLTALSCAAAVAAFVVVALH
jgi:hypothetical protein